MTKKLIPALLVTLSLIACNSEPTTPPVSKDPDTRTSNSQTCDLACGCVLPEVGHCSEHIKLDGKFWPLKISGQDLGKMPFCGKTGLRAKVEGTLEDGKFVATSFTYADK
ncbi:MAG: hypothetical protein QF412_10420 [Planctomycetota bacterium]|nr:hypothetical protein [Planctomycetota bacterium]